MNLIGQEDIIFYNDIYEVFWKNQASGCTMIFDRNLAGFILKFHPQCKKWLHDNWTYRVAKLIGTTVIFDKNSNILYRQHGDNAVGMNSLGMPHTILWYFGKAFLLLIIPRGHTRLHFAEEIYMKYNRYLPEKNKTVLNDFFRYRYNLPSKIRLISNQDMKKRDLKMKLAWVYKVIFNWI